MRPKEFNTRVAYVQSKSDANVCFANAWNMDHILGTANDPSYPNSTYNSDENESLLQEGDYVLLESFAVNTTSYNGNNGYASKSDWKTRGDKAVLLRDTYGINMASVGVINDDNANGQDLFNFSYYSACAFNLEAHGTSSTSYGASTAAVKMWPRPSVKFVLKKGEIISVVEDASDSDKYLVYGNFKKMVIDHSSGNQSVTVTRY